MSKALSGITALALLLFGGDVYAAHVQDCEQQHYAKQYSVMFSDRLDGSVGRLDTLSRVHQERMQTMQSALIQAGVWSKDDADIFVKNIMQGDEGQVLELERKNVHARFNATMSSPAWKATIAASPATIDHVMCLQGPRILEDAELVLQTMEKVFHYREMKVAEFAKEKKAILPDLP